MWMSEIALSQKKIMNIQCISKQKIRLVELIASQWSLYNLLFLYFENNSCSNYNFAVGLT